MNRGHWLLILDWFVPVVVGVLLHWWRPRVPRVRGVLSVLAHCVAGAVFVAPGFVVEKAVWILINEGSVSLHEYVDGLLANGAVAIDTLTDGVFPGLVIGMVLSLNRRVERRLFVALTVAPLVLIGWDLVRSAVVNVSNIPFSIMSDVIGGPMAGTIIAAVGSTVDARILRIRTVEDERFVKESVITTIQKSVLIGVGCVGVMLLLYFGFWYRLPERLVLVGDEWRALVLKDAFSYTLGMFGERETVQMSAHLVEVGSLGGGVDVRWRDALGDRAAALTKGSGRRLSILRVQSGQDALKLLRQGRLGEAKRRGVRVYEGEWPESEMNLIHERKGSGIAVAVAGAVRLDGVAPIVRLKRTRGSDLEISRSAGGWLLGARPLDEDHVKDTALIKNVETIRVRPSGRWAAIIVRAHLGPIMRWTVGRYGKEGVELASAVRVRAGARNLGRLVLPADPALAETLGRGRNVGAALIVLEDYGSEGELEIVAKDGEVLCSGCEVHDEGDPVVAREVAVGSVRGRLQAGAKTHDLDGSTVRMRANWEIGETVAVKELGARGLKIVAKSSAVSINGVGVNDTAWSAVPGEIRGAVITGLLAGAAWIIRRLWQRRRMNAT